MYLPSTLAALLLVLLPLTTSAQDPPLPRQLGTFSLPYAGFVVAFPKTDFEGDPRDLYDLYMTTFNAAPFAGTDPVYRILSPGRRLDEVDDWGLYLQQLGGDTAYWPNFPCQLPKDVRIKMRNDAT